MNAKALAKKQEAELMELGSVDEFGVEEQSSDDIVMPKLLVMQPGSNLVTEGTARFGEFRNSLNSDLLGSIEKPLEMMPIKIIKTWIVSKKLDGMWKFYSIDPFATASESRPYEHVVDGVPTKNEMCYNLYCLVGDNPLPYVVSLKGMSRRAGQEAYTHLYTTNQRLRRVLPFTDKLILSGKKTQNDKGTFVTLSIKAGVEATFEEKKAAADWCKVLNTTEVKVDASDTTPKKTADVDTTANTMDF